MSNNIEQAKKSISKLMTELDLASTEPGHDALPYLNIYENERGRLTVELSGNGDVRNTTRLLHRTLGENGADLTFVGKGPADSNKRAFDFREVTNSDLEQISALAERKDLPGLTDDIKNLFERSTEAEKTLGLQGKPRLLATTYLTLDEMGDLTPALSLDVYSKTVNKFLEGREDEGIKGEETDWKKATVYDVTGERAINKIFEATTTTSEELRQQIAEQKGQETGAAIG